MILPEFFRISSPLHPLRIPSGTEMIAEHPLVLRSQNEPAAAQLIFAPSKNRRRSIHLKQLIGQRDQILYFYSCFLWVTRKNGFQGLDL